MSWLDKMFRKDLASLPKDAFSVRTFGFGDIERVVDLVEHAVKENAETTKAANLESLMAAARDPFAEGKSCSTLQIDGCRLLAG